MPDVQATAELLHRLVRHGATTGRWRSLRQVRADGLYPPKAGPQRQQQDRMF